MLNVLVSHVATPHSAEVRSPPLARAVLGLGLALALVGCGAAPDPAQNAVADTDAAGNLPPRVTSFTASPTQGGAPLKVTFSWQVKDPEGRALACALDADGDGTPEFTFSPCPASGGAAYTYTSPGSYSARLLVTDAGGATAQSVTGVAVSAAGNAGGAPDPFDITLRFTSDVTDAQRQAFEGAARRWAGVIARGLPDVQVSAAEAAQGCKLNAASGVAVDDLLILASVTSIDGRGGVLGQAGPCLTRGGAPDFPAVGIMQFDAADLSDLAQNGQLQDVITHEMGHVLGFGTLWDAKLTAGTGTGTSCGASPTFTGANARREWQALGGSGGVPLENEGGQGTCEGHWSEKIFGSELMTGYVNQGSDPLSRLTVGALQDMGYQVNYAAADAYRRPSGVAALSAKAFKLNTTLIRPPKTIR